MNNNKKSFSSVVISAVAVMGLALGACQSKKKVEDSAKGSEVTAEQQAPQIENTPMSFDAAGSDSGKIEGLHTVHFDYDKSNLSAEAKKTIQQNAQWMKSHSGKVQIEGHCDARGSIEYNLSLGERRAKAVKSYMTSLGVAGDRLPIISYGKEKPLDSGDSEAAYAKNRRANFLPLGN